MLKHDVKHDACGSVILDLNPQQKVRWATKVLKRSFPENAPTGADVAVAVLGFHAKGWASEVSG